MTVCIGAICHDGATLVCAADQMVSLPKAQGEMLQKGWRLRQGSKWLAMNAGLDIRHAEGVLLRVERLMGDEPTADKMLAALGQAYQHELRSKREPILWGWTDKVGYDEFMAGAGPIAPDVRETIIRQMEERTIESDFLVCGFGPGVGDAEIMLMKDGQAERVTNYGHWAIGSGESLAVHSLMAHGHGRGTRPYGLAVYLVAAAKFAAEADKNVGPKTNLLIFDCNQKFVTVGATLLAELRRLWEATPTGKIPKGVSDLVNQVIRLDD